MSKTITFEFRVAKKGGKLGGQMLRREIPDFDWDEFKFCPNREAFTKKAYFEAVKRIVREIEGSTGNSSPDDLQSIESVLARSLSHTKQEIAEWIDSREWNAVTFRSPRENALPILTEVLTTRRFPSSPASRNRLAEIVATVADKPNDPIADHLFSCLTLPVSEGPVLSDAV